jgi:hypothetical protein
MSGMLVHEHDETLDAEALSRGAGDRDVAEMRGIEGTAV